MSAPKHPPPADPVLAAFAEVRARQATGEIPMSVPLSARADWAYGNAVIENADVTRAMALSSASKRG